MPNGTMLQFFHWYYPADGSLWNHAAAEAPRLASLGITAVWLPPAYKGMKGPASEGYDVYDIYDLGEFDQKGSVRTKYGTKDEYIQAVAALHAQGIQVYADAVLNHKGGADETERVRAIRFNPHNRNEQHGDPIEIEAHTRFTFPGRGGKYSPFIWDFRCFTGVDYAADLQEKGIFSILNEYGEGWEEVVTDELGNYDFLMLADIEFRNPAVREELKRWGEWYLQETGVDGFRLDAIKHITPHFFNEWLDHLRGVKPDLFAVGEFWSPGRLPLMTDYIAITGGRMSLFDASLQNNFRDASDKGRGYDLSKIFDGTLVAERPELAVTLVSNHDTQPLQSLEAPVQPWFRPLAYALILLRESGYPCVFYPNLYGARYVDKGRDELYHEVVYDRCPGLEALLALRQSHAYGPQRDYFDHMNCIGWTRAGDEANEGCAVLLSGGDAGFKEMEMGKRYAGKTFVDYLRNDPAEITLDAEGRGLFRAPAGSLSVWVEKK